MRQDEKGVILSKIANSIGGVIVFSLLGTPLAFAETKIHEVQPWPVDAPTQLVIWGTGFGVIDDSTDTPAILIGTSQIQLDIPADQSLCPTPLGGIAPPLDTTGFDCVVAELPVANNGEPNIPAGDYLLEIWVEGPEECAEKPSSLTFKYQSAACPGANLQNAPCTGDPQGSPADFVTAGHNKATWVPANGVFTNGSEVTFTGDGKWPNQFTVTIDGAGSGVQSIDIHTSCSQPLAIGDVFGSLELTAMIAIMKPSQQHDLYDLTLGAAGPEGPQGPQGKLGDTGAQGVQGKLGDTGAQGVQGKLGDTGAQGVQGKLGDTGAQGVQGKLGDTGAQGVQGKLGDTGAQGVQGKLGDTGAQGVQGKLGDTGAQGVQGKLGDTGAQGVQGKLGDTGAQGVQGKLGDTGAQGVQGKIGDTGPQGVAGTNGTSGAIFNGGTRGNVDNGQITYIGPYLMPGTSNTVEATVAIRVTGAVSICSFRAEIDANVGASPRQWGLILRKNSADTTIACNILPATSGCSFTGTAVAWAAGDTMDVKVTPSATAPTNKPISWVAGGCP